MQVFGLPGYIIRNAVARWRAAIDNGLTATQAAEAVGVPRATLYRWRSNGEPGSRKPHRGKSNTWTSTLVAAVERLRLDFPIWG